MVITFQSDQQADSEVNSEGDGTGLLIFIISSYVPLDLLPGTHLPLTTIFKKTLLFQRLHMALGCLLCR